VSLPAPLFDSLRDFVLARSSEEHRLTIRIEGDPVTPYSAVRYHSNSHQNAVCAEDMVWLQEHVNVEIVPHEHTHETKTDLSFGDILNTSSAGTPFRKQ
jgi:hypothetical protein